MKEAVESPRHRTLAWPMEETPDLVERRAAYNSTEVSRRLMRILKAMKPGEEPMLYLFGQRGLETDTPDGEYQLPSAINLGGKKKRNPPSTR
jgi:hypothetical protein